MEKLNKHKSGSGRRNTHSMESDEDSNLTALFQDSDNSSVELEQEVWGAPRLPLQDTDSIIDQLNLKLTTHNPFLCTGYYRRHKVVVVRQREDLKTPVEDVIEETESTDRKLLDGSDSTRARLANGELVKDVLVPTFAGQTVHGSRGNTIQAIETVNGCSEVIMEIESETKRQNLTIRNKEG